MRILYGVSGEGSGHSSRAIEIGRFLQETGHELLMVSYDRGARNLSATFPLIEVEGLHIVSENNRVRPLQTLLHNVRRGFKALHRLRSLRHHVRDFRPEVVITDFEPTTAWLALLKGLPLISLDNQHRMRYMDYNAPRRLWLSRCLTETIIRLMVPAPDIALATTFFEGPVKNNRTFLFPPILRREVLECVPSTGHHHLVYMTSAYDDLLRVLSAVPQHTFLVYGSGRAGCEGNLTFKPFSNDGFLQDLASCRSVIATAGFTLISESLYLGKPYLAMPLSGQFEQQLNALCLEELGAGISVDCIDEDKLRCFLADLPRLQAAALRYADSRNVAPASQANQAICAKLDETLTALAAQQLCPG